VLFPITKSKFSWRAAWLICCWIASSGAWSANAPETVTRTGKAYDIESGDFIYSEHHKEVYVDGRPVKCEVVYRSPDGGIIARKLIDFAEDPYRPNFKLESTKTGHVEGAHRSGESLEVQFRRNADAPIERHSIALPETAVIDAGFDRVIEQHWSELTGGGTVDRDFLLPSLGRFVSFRIRQVAVGDGVREIALEPASAWLRLITKPIYLKYVEEKPALLSFRGVSNLRDAKGRNYRVEIIFPQG